MSVVRYVGAAWASVHGPATPRELALWTLDLGFSGILPGPAPRPVDWSAVRRHARDLPFDLGSAVRLNGHAVAAERDDRGLGSRDAGDRRTAVAALCNAAETATRLGLDRVICEPGTVPLAGEAGPVDLGDPDVRWEDDRAKAQIARRNVALDAAMDGACRALYEVCKRFPDVTFCLGPSAHVAGLGSPEPLAAIFEDLSGQRLGYWHDAAITVRRQEVLGEDQGIWLDRFADRLGGLTLGDSQDGELRRPPGAGLVDYPLLASYITPAARRVPAVVELDPSVPPDEIPRVHSFLSKFGL